MAARSTIDDYDNMPAFLMRIYLNGVFSILYQTRLGEVYSPSVQIVTDNEMSILNA